MRTNASCARRGRRRSIQAAVRIAAVVHAIAATLNGEAAISKLRPVPA